MKRKKKTCLDCYHCKVSMKSIVKKGLCYCEVKTKKIIRKEKYWRGKEICVKFEDASA